jgi:hypothetical protein
MPRLADALGIRVIPGKYNRILDDAGKPDRKAAKDVEVSSPVSHPKP